MTTRRFLSALAGAAVVALIAAPGARAASSVESGWWTSVPLLAAPDVSEDQLLVQGGADQAQPLAYAGISFTLEPGEVPGALALFVAPQSASTPGATLALCPLDEAASSAAGEPAADGPSFDCTTKVETAPSSGGTSYTFDLAGFVAAGSLDVAVLPTQPTDRVVLAKPVSTSLQDGSGPAGVTSSDSFTGGSPSSGGGGVTPADSSIDAPAGPAAADLPALDEVSAPAPTPSETPAASGAPTSGADAPADLPAVPAASGNDASSRAGLAFVGLLAAAAALWAVAGQHDGREPAVNAAVADAGETR